MRDHRMYLTCPLCNQVGTLFVKTNTERTFILICHGRTNETEGEENPNPEVYSPAVREVLSGIMPPFFFTVL